jgi:hypothetical protein
MKPVIKSLGNKGNKVTFVICKTVNAQDDLPNQMFQALQKINNTPCDALHGNLWDVIRNPGTWLSCLVVNDQIVVRATGSDAHINVFETQREHRRKGWGSLAFSTLASHLHETFQRHVSLYCTGEIPYKAYCRGAQLAGLAVYVDRNLQSPWSQGLPGEYCSTMYFAPRVVPVASVIDSEKAILTEGEEHVMKYLAKLDVNSLKEHLRKNDSWVHLICMGPTIHYAVGGIGAVRKFCLRMPL